MASTWWAGARDSRANTRARSNTARRPSRSSRGAVAPSAVRAARAVDRDRGLGGVRRRRAGHRRDVVEQGAVRVVADRGDHRHAQQRDRPAQRLVAEREQVGQRAAAARDDDHLDLRAGRQILQRAADRRRRVAIRTGAKPHTIRPAQPRRRRPARTSSRALPDSPVTTPMQRGRPGRGSAFCGAKRPSASQPPPQLLELGQQVALAGHAQPRDRERERRRGGARARGSSRSRRRRRPARRRRAPQPQLLEVLAPHRARQRARGVAQLEPDLRPPGLEAEHLAEDLDAREPRSRSRSAAA